MVALSNFDDSFLVLLSDVMGRLGRVTSSTLFNLVPRHLGEQLLELEADIKNMFANHKQAKIEQNRMILESERDKEGQARNTSKLEVVDLSDDLDVKIEKLEELVHLGTTGNPDKPASAQVIVQSVYTGGSKRVSGQCEDLDGDDAGRLVDGDVGGDDNVGGQLVDHGGVGEVVGARADHVGGGDWGGSGVGEGVDKVKKDDVDEDLTSFIQETIIGEKEAKKVEYLEKTVKTEKCDVCQKKFGRKCALSRHKAMHNKVYIAPSCPFCGKILKGSIKRHILTKHPNKKNEVRVSIIELF